MRLLRLILQWFGRLRKWKLRLPHVDSHSWQNKEQILHDLKCRY
ncbi:MAG: hypothetical protein ABII09_03210 [Planctomycetota bacterium]